LPSAASLCRKKHHAACAVQRHSVASRAVRRLLGVARMDGLLVISPHLDDAVLGCGALLAQYPGSVVVTVFAGAPAEPARLTEWDGRCGFANAGDAMAQRRAEDAHALRLLEARPVWLPFCDAQYGEPCTSAQVAEALQAIVQAHPRERLLYPLGLYHSDHRLTHDAVRSLLRHMPARDAWVYEDALYRGLPGVLQERLAELAAQRLRATLVRLPKGGATAAFARRKAAAVQAYASQLRAFGPGGIDDAAQPERCWSLGPIEKHDDA
jgi:LmbE family N-acetylglucosaminyl deacetylase